MTWYAIVYKLICKVISEKLFTVKASLLFNQSYLTVALQDNLDAETQIISYGTFKKKCKSLNLNEMFG